MHTMCIYIYTHLHGSSYLTSFRSELLCFASLEVQKKEKVEKATARKASQSKSKKQVTDTWPQTFQGASRTTSSK